MSCVGLVNFVCHLSIRHACCSSPLPSLDSILKTGGHSSLPALDMISGVPLVECHSNVQHVSVFEKGNNPLTAFGLEFDEQ